MDSFARGKKKKQKQKHKKRSSKAKKSVKRIGLQQQQW
ncbi:hypothetical protein MRX96_041352 [Rhipicephalus microplus]